MIGIIKSGGIKVFEFREGELEDKLNTFVDKYDADTIFITTGSDKVKAIIYDGKFTLNSKNFRFEEDINYYLYATTDGKYKNLQKDDKLPKDVDFKIDKMQFSIINGRMPTSID